MAPTKLLERVTSGLNSRRPGRNGSPRGLLAANRRRSLPLGVEPLEGRMLLATITVNSAADELFQARTATVHTEVGNMISLRDAINIANNTGGANTIVLQRYHVYKLDKIDNYWYGPDGLPAISSAITIQGNGATIERDDGSNFRFFYVSNSQYGGLPDGSLTLQYLTLQGGKAKGGDSHLGGGGLGAGGAIFNAGTLLLDSVLLVGNTAQGGNSRTYSYELWAGGGIGQDAPDSHPSRDGGGFGGPLPGSVNFTNGGPTREGQGGSIRYPAEKAGFGGGGNGYGKGANDGGFGGGGGGNNGGGGSGGFGGGGGASYDSSFPARGGGGAGLGGAIFNRGGNIIVLNSTLTNNGAAGGDGAWHLAGTQAPSGAGSAFGGAIFNLDGTVRLTNDTIAGNNLDGGGGSGGRTDGYQLYNLADSLDGKTVTAALTLANTILAGAPGDSHDLVNQTFDNAPNNQATITNADPQIDASANIITTAIANLDGKFANDSGGLRGVVNLSYNQVDPLLENLGNNGGRSRTMALKPNSPARSAGVVALAIDPQGDRLIYDQRGPSFPRSPSGVIDIGAFQSTGGPAPAAISLGTIWVGPSASGEALQALRTAYTTARLRPGNRTGPGPIVVGAADLDTGRIVAQLKASYAAGQTVAMTNATRREAAELSSLLGQENPARWGGNVPKASLVAFRQVSMPGSPALSQTMIELPTKVATSSPGVRVAAEPSPIYQQDLGWLTTVFAVVPPAPSVSIAGPPSVPPNLYDLAHAWQDTVYENDTDQNSVVLTVTAQGVRSFTNKADYYLVQQQVQQTVGRRPGNDLKQAVSDTITAPVTRPAFTPIESESPQSTYAQTSVTTGWSFSVGGSIGYQAGETGGFNGSVSVGFTYNHSKTTTYPPIDIKNLSDPVAGFARWQFGLHTPPSDGQFHDQFDSGFITKIPFDVYRANQTRIGFSSDSSLFFNPGGNAPPALELHLDLVMPMPFDAFALRPPLVKSVSEKTVQAGREFTINGSGLYPSLVTGVTIGGQPLDPRNYSSVSDTQIKVVAPPFTGKAEPKSVVVQTTEGESNADVKITILPSS
jgi:hypothetical protein